MEFYPVDDWISKCRVGVITINFSSEGIGSLLMQAESHFFENS